MPLNVTNNKIPVILSYADKNMKKYTLTMHHTMPGLCVLVPGRNPLIYQIKAISLYPTHHKALTTGVMTVKDWMKKAINDRIGQKRLAFAMGLHPRLGESSPILGLGGDLLWYLNKWIT
jgi:hypothetical protein